MTDATTTAARIMDVSAPQPPRGDLEHAIATGTAVRHREPKLPASHDVLSVVQRMSGISPAEKALEYHGYLIALILTYGDLWDTLTLDTYQTKDDFRAALENAPPGVFDIRSWHYWNIVCGRTPVPPLPQRQIPGVDPAPQSNSPWS